MQQLRVDTAALQTMAASWQTSAGELGAAAGPGKLRLSLQLSAAAVHAAHADVAIFTVGLAARVDMRARHVSDTGTRYIAHDSHSVGELAALTDSSSVA